jgi:hypothetical protein
MLIILAEAALRSLLLGGIVLAALGALRVRNPHIQMFAWVLVLLASLAMPLAMDWATLTVTHPGLPAPERLLPLDGRALEPLQEFGETLGEVAAPAMAATKARTPLDWSMAATAVYAAVGAAAAACDRTAPDLEDRPQRAPPRGALAWRCGRAHHACD